MHRVPNSRRLILCVAGAALIASAAAAQAQPVFMSAEWAKSACEAWNSDPVLTNDLVTSGWTDNDEGRGFKVMQIYRSDCEGSPRVEMRISKQDGKAMCVYGGPVETTGLTGADYVMYAETRRWREMGQGDYGPMKAMMFGRLKFEGPMFEAMNNMGPFKSFLLIPGKVDSNMETCP